MPIEAEAQNRIEMVERNQEAVRRTAIKKKVRIMVTKDTLMNTWTVNVLAPLPCNMIGPKELREGFSTEKAAKEWSDTKEAFDLAVKKLEEVAARK